MQTPSYAVIFCFDIGEKLLFGMGSADYGKRANAVNM
jgi:hypothetical protein